MGGQGKQGRRVICRCLGVTEADLIHCIRTHGARTLKDIARLTEAGDGCTACHPAIRDCLSRWAPGA